MNKSIQRGWAMFATSGQRRLAVTPKSMWVNLVMRAQLRARQIAVAALALASLAFVSVTFAGNISTPQYQISALSYVGGELRIDPNGHPYTPIYPVIAYLHPSDVNSAGRVVGTLSDGSGYSNRAYYYDTSTGERNIFGNALGVSGAYDVNEAGEVLFGMQAVGAGNAILGSLLVRHIDGTIATLGVGSYRKPSFNNNHVVVGQLLNELAFYFADGVQYILESMVVDLDGFSQLTPTDINDNGFIVGYGRQNGEVKNFLLQPIINTAPVPEPSSLALFSLAFAALSLTKRKVERD